MGNISFLMPWAFVGLGILPLMWLLMKTTPPKPKKIRFPAVRLLQELSTEKIVATKTPWWVLLVRCLLVVLLILALSQPVINQAKSIGESQNPLVVIIDNDWSVMDRWADREQELALMIDQAERLGRDILLVATADQISDTPLEFGTAQNARAQSAALLVRPWQTNRSAWLIKLENTLGILDESIDIFWISNGLVEDRESRFVQRLDQLGSLNIIGDAQTQIPPVIKSVKRITDGLSVNLLSNSLPTDRPLSLQMLDDQGRVIFVHEATLVANETEHKLELTFPEEMRAQTERLRLSGHINAGSQYLMDERWRDKAVGILAQSEGAHSLLDSTFYLDKALSPYVNIRFETIDHLLERDLSLLIDIGRDSLNADQRENVYKWIKNGGIFVRFANEGHSEKTIQEDPLLPVSLLRGMRTFGGSLSWKEDPRLAPFDSNSPFQGIELSDEIFIHQQVLARPSTQISDNIWARLRDGTPLITAKKIENGFSVLFHIAISPEASDLPISGIFEEMMIQLVSLSTGFSSADPSQELNPYLVFDNNGQLSPAGDGVRARKVSDLKNRNTSPMHPPGLYGQATSLKAFNLGSKIESLHVKNNIPSSATVRGFDQVNEIDLVPWVLLAVLVLALTDWIMTLRLKKYFKPATTTALAFLLFTAPLSANEPLSEDWDKIINAANNMRLAYLVTGDGDTDTISKRGLDGLSQVLRRRTAVEFAKPMAFDPEKDDPALFPMIYWPVGDTHDPLSDKASKRLNRFLKAGGFILFDTMGQVQTETMTQLAEQLNIGRLSPVREPHVMTRSFYLMERFPGRYDNPEIWVEASEDAARDRVSSILVGSNSWAHAWARDDDMRPLYPVVPGGEIQREHAYRFGVNLVMYILSGNYKGDQVHMPAIIQRLGL